MKLRPYATGRLFLRGVKIREWVMSEAQAQSGFGLEQFIREFPDLALQPHIFEIECHDLPGEVLRFGSDREMMVDPRPLEDFLKGGPTVH